MFWKGLLTLKGIENVSCISFSFDSKFIFTAGGDCFVRQISAITLRVVWVFEYLAIAPCKLFALSTSPRIITVSSSEISIINYRSKLQEFQENSLQYKWKDAWLSPSSRVLFLKNLGPKKVFTLDMSTILDHRISVTKRSLLDTTRSENFIQNPKTMLMIGYNGPIVRVIKETNGVYEKIHELKGEGTLHRSFLSDSPCK